MHASRESSKQVPLAAALVVLACLAVSALHPYDRLTWWMEIAPVLIAFPVLLWTYSRFPFTGFLYVLIALHALVLILGGAYSYARVPLGHWMQDAMSLSRNPYDRVGHFMQGFVPALVAREIFIRMGFVTGKRMAAFLSVCVAMTISASYELIEWAAAVSLGQGADEFLGTQGDPWDTQSDMFMALIGASVAVLLFSRLHDRAIGRLSPTTG
jgi:putative membrane protein